MSELNSEQISLLEEFTTLHNHRNIPKILRLKKKIQKYLNLSDVDDNAQLLDVVRILDMYITEYEYHDSEYVYRIASPTIERLVNKKKWDTYDIFIASIMVAAARDYIVAHELAQRVLVDLENNVSCTYYKSKKLAVCMNASFRLLKAKCFEFSKGDAELDNLYTLFMKYINQILELGAKYEVWWEFKAIALLREGVFRRDYQVVDEQLTIIAEKGDNALYKITVDEVSRYNVFTGDEITKVLLNIQIGKSIRKLRKSKYLTLERLAKMCNMKHASLQAIEQGKMMVSVYNLNKLAAIFEMSMDEVAKGAAKPENKHEEELSLELEELMCIAKELSVSEILTLNTVARQLAEGR